MGKDRKKSMYENNRYYEEEKDLEPELKDQDDINQPHKDEEIKIEVKKDGKKIHHLEKEIHSLKEKMEALEIENKEIKEKYLRTLAESENFKKRIDEERIRERKYGSQRLLEKLVESTDIFDKACNAKFDDQMMMNFLYGFKMINDKIQDVLASEGVKKIEIGKYFDPKFMQAMEVDYDPEKEENEILQVFKTGYMYKDRVLVYAMVKVNKKPEEKTEVSSNDDKAVDNIE